MKIVVFYQYFGTPKGGWSTRIYELTKRWVKDGNQVTVVTSPYYKSDIEAKGFVSRQNFDGIEVIVINSPDNNKKGFVKRAVNAVIFSLTSIYYAFTLPMDVVVSSSGPILIGIPGLMAKWFRRKPFVFEVRDLWPKGAIELEKIKKPGIIKVALGFEKLLYRNSDLVVACSPGMEAGVNGVDRSVKTMVIPNASDPELFDIPKARPDHFPAILEGKKIFLYAGSLGLMDDCSQIIKGMNQVIDKSFALVIVGDGAESDHLRKLASSNPNIVFIGLVPKHEVVKWFSMASASFVTFMDKEVLHTSSPNKMFDSFAAGVPIIQSTKGWIKDLVAREGCGLNVDPHDPEDFARAILKIGDNPEVREQMARNAKRLALTEFNRSLLADKYLQSLKKLES